MLRVYAIVADYNQVSEEPWPADDVATLQTRLRSASVEVDRLTRLSVFDVDEDGFPTDPDISDAFAEATCAIAEFWSITDDPTGAEATVGAVKIGSVSLGTTSSSQDSATPAERLQRRIGSKAIDILVNAGLLTSTVAHT